MILAIVRVALAIVRVALAIVRVALANCQSSLFVEAVFAFNIYNSAKLLIIGFLLFFANYSYKLRLRELTNNVISLFKEARIKVK